MKQKSMLLAGLLLTLTSLGAAGKLQSEYYVVSPSLSTQEQTYVYGQFDDSRNMKIIHRGPQWLMSENDYQFQGGAVRKGYYYMPVFSQDMITADVTISWRKIDIRTGEQTDQWVIKGDDNIFAFCYSLTYDPGRDCFWGLCYNAYNGTGGTLVKIDASGPEKDWTPEVTGISVGSSESNWANTIVYSPVDTQLYILNRNGELKSWSAEKRNGSYQQPVSVYNYDSIEQYWCFPNPYEACPMVYSPKDHAFVGIFLNRDAQQAEVFAIDGKTFETENHGVLNPLAFYSSIFNYDSYAEDDAPDAVEGLTVAFDKGSTAATVSLTMPSADFSGLPYASGKNLTLKMDVDGEAAWSGTFGAGREVSFSYNFSEGLHEVSVLAADGDKTGAPESRTIYAGNDAPLPPSSLSLSGLTLSWEAPAEGSAHGGYVDPKSLTYNVYDGNQRLNDTPVEGLSFTLTEPARMSLHHLTVRAVHSGHESEPSPALEKVLGKALELPVSLAPTAEQAPLFDSHNLNGDENSFRFNPANEPPCMEIVTAQYWEKPDDELVLPKMHLASTESQYELSFSYQGAYRNDKHMQHLEVFLRKAPEAGADDQKIYSHSARAFKEEARISASFSITEAGDYYIVLHEFSDNYDPASPYPLNRGARFHDFSVSEMAGTSTDAPSAVTDVTFTPVLDGSNSAKVTFTAPATNIKGEPLAADTEITVTAQTEGGEPSSAVVTPGAPGELTVTAPHYGMATFTLTPYSSEGGGQITRHSCYVGADTPTPVKNLTWSISEDNMTIHMAWEPPTEGVNGGYIDPAALSYPVISLVGGAQYVTVGETKECKFSYTTPSTVQANYSIGPRSKNRVGMSNNNVLAFDQLGTPYDLPMVEEFPSGGFSFDYSKWSYSMEGEFAGIEWNNASNFTGAGIGDPVAVRGAFYAYPSESEGGYGQLIAPKFSTKGVPKALVTIRYWDFAKAAGVELWARSDKDQTLRKIAETTPTRPVLRPDWVDWETKLPDDLLDCGWVQINVRTLHSDADQIFVMDTYSVLQDVNHDFRVSSLKAPYSVTVGQTAHIETTAVNSGKSAGRTKVTLELLSDGTPVAERHISTTRIPASSTYVLTADFPIITEYSGTRLQVKARVESDDDEVAVNNERIADIVLHDSPLPLVTDMSARRNDDGSGIALTWSEPDLKMSNIEGFEALPFGGTHSKLGRWQNIDLDKGAPFVLASGGGTGTPLEWDDYDKPGAWQMINATELGLSNTDRVYPYSGDCFLLARSVDFGASPEPFPSADWLISPEVKGGTKVTFQFNTLSSEYPETISIFYSTTDDRIATDEGVESIKTAPDGSMTCGSFRLGRHFTKSGLDSWEPVSWTLPEDARYFALVYRSIGQFGAMIDDLEFTPAGDIRWNLYGYEVYRVADGKETCIKTDVKTTTFTDTNVNNGQAYAYGVKAVVRDDEDNYFTSPMSNLAHVAATGATAPEADGVFIGGGKGFVLAGGLAGRSLSVYTADGTCVLSTTVASERESYELPAGIYIVRCGKTVAKVIVK